MADRYETRGGITSKQDMDRESRVSLEELSVKLRVEIDGAIQTVREFTRSLVPENPNKTLPRPVTNPLEEIRSNLTDSLSAIQELRNLIQNEIIERING